MTTEFDLERLKSTGEIVGDIISDPVMLILVGLPGSGKVSDGCILYDDLIMHIIIITYLYL